MAASREAVDFQTPPDELTGPTPRRVSASDNTTKSAMAFGFLVLVFGAVAIWGSATAYRQYQLRTALRQTHEMVTGTVTRVLHGRGSATVDYTFSIAGVDYFGSAEVRSVADPQPAEPIQIRYSPANPAMNHPDAWEWSAYSDLPPFVFSYFMLFMGCIAIVYLLRTRKLVAYGQPAVASVENCVSNGKFYRIEYSFRTESGGEQSGKSDSKEALEIGSKVWILHLPQNPRRNCIYPNAEFDVW